MESTDSSTALQQRPQLPPGFRFHPTDEELVVHYLNKKIASAPLPVSIIAEVNLYKFDPWELPAKATFGEQEWYFFTPRDRKYPNGARPNRAATSGYWKATGTDKPIMASGGTQKVGVKKALVFYGGKPPRGIKTNWIMHEYRLAEDKTNSKPPGCNKKGSSRLDDWVLCRIYKRNNSQRPADHDRCDSLNDMLGPIGPSTINSIHVGIGEQNPKLPPLKTSNYGALLEDEHNVNMFEGMVSSNTTDGCSMSQLVQSGSSKPQLPMFSATAPPHLPVKLPLPTPYSWNDRENTETGGCSLTTKRFLADGDDESVAKTDENNGPSIATLLSQFPQTPPLHQQTMLGSLGDGAFRQPYQFSGLNWYS